MNERYVWEVIIKEKGWEREWEGRVRLSDIY